MVDKGEISFIINEEKRNKYDWKYLVYITYSHSEYKTILYIDIMYNEYSFIKL